MRKPAPQGVQASPARPDFFKLVDLCVKARAAGYTASVTIDQPAVKIENFLGRDTDHENNRHAAAELYHGLKMRGFAPVITIEQNKYQVFIK